MGKHHKRHKIPTIIHAGFSIRETRPEYYVVDMQIHNKRIRKGYSNLDEAKGYCELKRDQIRAQGMNALVLPESVKTEALKALEILKPCGGSILAAAREYARRHPATVTETFRETCDRYLADMEKQGRRDASVKDKRIKFAKLCEGLGKRPSGGIDDLDVTTVVEEQGYTNGTARAYIGAAKSALAFFRGEKKDKRLEDDKVPDTWDVATVKKLMAAAEEHTPDFVPGLALLFFAGLRPDEVRRLSWDAIDLQDHEIHLGGDVTKTRTSRTVPIEENLLAWLAAYRGEGAIVSTTGRYRKAQKTVMEKCGIERWPVDVARHTFATAYYKSKNDVGAVMSALGHFGSADTFVRHYKGVAMGKTAAKSYFKIRPEAESNVIPMAKSAVA